MTSPVTPSTSTSSSSAPACPASAPATGCRPSAPARATRSSRPATRSAAPGTCSATPGIRSDSDMFTLGYPFEPWREAKSIADGPSILEYVRRDRGQARHRREDPLRHQGARPPTGRPRRPAGRSPWSTARRRRHEHADLRLPLLLRRLLRLRPAATSRCSPASSRFAGTVVAAAVLARGPRLRGQEGRRDRQRRDRGHAGPGDGRAGRARHDAAAHPDLDQRGPGLATRSPTGSARCCPPSWPTG